MSDIQTLVGSFQVMVVTNVIPNTNPTTPIKEVCNKISAPPVHKAFDPYPIHARPSVRRKLLF